MKDKVAIIDTLGAHGGSFHFYTFGQYYGLVKAGVDVRLYSNNKTPNLLSDERVFFSFYNNVFESKFRFINGFRWIIGSIKSILHARLNGVSVFHFHIFYSNILILFDLVLTRVIFGKVVLTIHDVISFSKKNNTTILNRFIYRLANVVITHNKFSKSEIINIYPRLTKNISIIPHGNYLPFINIINDQKRSREYLGLPSDKNILLFFGMIKEVKGLEILLESLAEVSIQDPNVVLLIAGKAWENDFSMYQKIIDENNLSDKIFLHNRFIPHKDVEHYYCASDLVVLPYKKIYQSGVLMMALSYEKTVLISDLPPIKEIIEDNKNGFLFKSEDVNDLSSKISFILNDRHNMERVRLNGNNLMKKKFNWNEIGRLTKNAYQSI